MHVNIGPDSGFGEHEAPAWYVSRDGGVEWEACPGEQVDLSPLPVTLPDARQVRLGNQQFMPHYAHADKENYRIYPEQYGLKPVFGPFCHAYTASEDEAYRLGDLPEEARSIPMAWRESESAEWHSSSVVFEVEGMLKTCSVRGLAWWSGVKDDWRDLEPCIGLQRFSHVVVLPDGTMISPAMSQHPDVTDRKYMQVLCLQSTDAGRTWSRPEKIAEFSVTPQLIVLENGAMAVGLRAARRLPAHKRRQRPDLERFRGRHRPGWTGTAGKPDRQGPVVR